MDGLKPSDDAILIFYVPETYLETVKDALFKVGAGKLGHYDCCCWQTIGTGQFKSLEGAHPHIGKMNEYTFVTEYKVEMVCAKNKIKKCVETLIQAHPYETPAYRIEEFYIIT